MWGELGERGLELKAVVLDFFGDKGELFAFIGAGFGNGIDLDVNVDVDVDAADDDPNLSLLFLAKANLLTTAFSPSFLSGTFLLSSSSSSSSPSPPFSSSIVISDSGPRQD